jgi:hypothetical protein
VALGSRGPGRREGGERDDGQGEASSMAILTDCSECGAEVSASVSEAFPLCEACRRRHGWKPWEEMTLEEKVEDLDRRLRDVGGRGACIG